MYTLQEISKPKRKKLVKNIEKHLKNYNNYKVAILNLSKQLEFIATNDNMEIFKESIDDDCEFQESVDKLASELQHIKLLKDSIDISLSELTELEYRFVQYRYFKN